MTLINTRFKFYKSVAAATVLLGLVGCGGHGHSAKVHGHDDGDGHHVSMAGEAGKKSKVDRIISMDMNDQMQFIPTSIAFTAGETIQFDVSNSGKILHEFVIGTKDEIAEHHELMKKFPGMEHEDEPNSVSLQADESGQVIWQFTKAGSYEFACLQPGHFEAGMRGTFTVAQKQ